MIHNSNFIPLPSWAYEESEDTIRERLPQTLEVNCEKHSIYLAELKNILKPLKSARYSECPQCQKERQDQKKQEEELHQKAVETAVKEKRLKMLCSRGVSERFLKKRKEFNSELPFISQHLKYLELDKEAKDFKIRDNLLIFGGVGIGKSFFAYRLVEKAILVNKKYVCIKAKELHNLYSSKTLESGFTRVNSLENLKEILEGIDCLIIDEIDDIAQNLECFKQVISFLYDKDSRFIVIGNCSVEEFKSILEPKTTDRIKGAIAFGGNFESLR